MATPSNTDFDGQRYKSDIISKIPGCRNPRLTVGLHFPYPRHILEQLLLTEPAATISKLAKMMPYHRFEDNARLADGLRLAGLPE